LDLCRSASETLGAKPIPEVFFGNSIRDQGSLPFKGHWGCPVLRKKTAGSNKIEPAA
jgi:hypothetical protein